MKITERGVTKKTNDVLEDLDIMIRSFKENENTSGLYLIEHKDSTLLANIRDIIYRYQKSFLDEIATLKRMRKRLYSNENFERKEENERLHNDTNT